MNFPPPCKKNLVSRSLVFLLGIGIISIPSVLHAQSWPVDGANNFDWRYQASESLIGTNNAGTLAPQWVFNTQGDVSATPTSQNNFVYFPDWAGNLYAVNAKTGTLVWSRSY